MKHKVLILYTEKTDTIFNEAVSRKVIEEIKASLKRNENFSTTSCSYSPNNLNKIISKHNPDYIFNLCYGYQDKSINYFESQADISAKLELLNLKVLGSSSSTQKLAQDKYLWSVNLAKCGILCPLLFTKNEISFYSGLCIEKPRIGACHRNIRILDTSKHIVTFKHGYLYQEYIDGPEFTVGMLEENGELIVFPPVEIMFSSKPNALGTDTKPINYQPDLSDRFGLKSLSNKIFHKMKLKDYARLDFRINPSGQPVLLDINSMPNLDRENSFLPMLAKFNGLTYDEFIIKLISNLIYRSK